MLRIRTPDGETIVLDGDPSAFVEICDVEGDIAQLVYRDSSGIIHIVSADDPEAANYARLFDVKFVKLSSI